VFKIITYQSKQLDALEELDEPLVPGGCVAPILHAAAVSALSKHWIAGMAFLLVKKRRRKNFKCKEQRNQQKNFFFFKLFFL
jgi:hypothetical protein